MRFISIDGFGVKIRVANGKEIMSNKGKTQAKFLLFMDLAE
jgi:hypothetical protein